MLTEVAGFRFNSETGEVTDPSGKLAPYTFDDVPDRNPLQFASRETATEVGCWVGLICHPGTTIEVVENLTSMYPTPRMIRASYQGKSVDLNAGLIANTAMRSGKKFAFDVVRSDLQRAGILLSTSID